MHGRRLACRQQLNRKPACRQQPPSKQQLGRVQLGSEAFRREPALVSTLTGSARRRAGCRQPAEWKVNA